MKSKNLLVVAGLALVLTAVGLASCSPSDTAGAAAATETVNVSSQQAGIWVTGQGKVSTTPDVATVRLGIESQELTVAEAQAKAAEAMSEVEDALAEAGVAAKDIQTQYFSVHQVTRWNRDTEQEVVIGFRVVNTVAAKVRDIDRIGEVLDAVVAAGGDLTRIDGISFSVDDPTAFHEQAREKAVKDARDKAEQLANLAGVSLGRATYISESSAGAPAPYPMSGALRSFDEAAATSMSISPGELDITVSVQVIYNIP